MISESFFAVNNVLGERILQTERLELFRIATKDWADFHRLHSSEQVELVQQSGETELVLRQKFERSLAEWNDCSSNWLSLMIRRRDQESTCVGMIGFVVQQDQHDCAELGYVIEPGFQRQGLASEALMAVARYSFENHELRKLLLLIEPRNLASIKVAEKVGFRCHDCLEKKGSESRSTVPLRYELVFEELTESI